LPPPPTGGMSVTSAAHRLLIPMANSKMHMEHPRTSSFKCPADDGTNNATHAARTEPYPSAAATNSFDAV
jgi:hypothetical protein